MRAGSVVGVPLQLDALSELNEIVGEIFKQPGVTIWMANYRFVSLEAVEIDSTRDVTEECHKAAHAKTISEEEQLLKKCKRSAR